MSVVTLPVSLVPSPSAVPTSPAVVEDIHSGSATTNTAIVVGVSIGVVLAIVALAYPLSKLCKRKQLRRYLRRSVTPFPSQHAMHRMSSPTNPSSLLARRSRAQSLAPLVVPEISQKLPRPPPLARSLHVHSFPQTPTSFSSQAPLIDLPVTSPSSSFFSLFFARRQSRAPSLIPLPESHSDPAPPPVPCKCGVVPPTSPLSVSEAALSTSWLPSSRPASSRPSHPILPAIPDVGSLYDQSFMQEPSPSTPIVTEVVASGSRSAYEVDAGGLRPGVYVQGRYEEKRYPPPAYDTLPQERRAVESTIIIIA